MHIVFMLKKLPYFFHHTTSVLRFLSTAQISPTTPCVLDPCFFHLRQPHVDSIHLPVTWNVILFRYGSCVQKSSWGIRLPVGVSLRRFDGLVENSKYFFSCLEALKQKPFHFYSCKNILNTEETFLSRQSCLLISFAAFFKSSPQNCIISPIPQQPSASLT